MLLCSRQFALLGSYCFDAQLRVEDIPMLHIGVGVRIFAVMVRANAMPA